MDSDAVTRFVTSVGGEASAPAANDAKADNINSPSHYTKGIQTYDYIKSWDMNFAYGNVIKYVSRAPFKGNTLEDLKKAQWYLNKLIEEVSNG
jgi:hypothetical protein